MKMISILLTSLFIVSTCYAEKIVLYDKVNQKYVNDFQSEATEDTLIKNTGRNTDEFEVKKITDEEFITLEKEINEPIRKDKQAVFEAEKILKENKKQAVLEKLKISKEELELILKR